LEYRQLPHARMRLEPAKDGKAGHCLPKDIIYMSNLSADSQLIKAAVLSSRLYVAKRLHDLTRAGDLELVRMKLQPTLTVPDP
jgi:hypothetical protein